MLLVSLIMLSSCTETADKQTLTTSKTMNNWLEILTEEMPLLGHRNWIVVTDMAYPLQSNPSILTLYASEPYAEVLSSVKQLIDNSPHVFAHVYQDEEQQAMSEDLSTGWNAYRTAVDEALGEQEVAYVLHEELINRLDEVARLYRVVIIKTNLTIPYSSTFFELDCDYWDAKRQSALLNKLIVK